MTQRPAALYTISVAAEICGTGVQNLRIYEQRGLVAPERSPGGTRKYSDADVAAIQRVVELLDEGLNLAGIRKVLALEAEVRRLREQTQGH
ncbi:MerR family transcriptional regulator [Humidisolicoccus flavus]|uniref:MerR family transcriptional regulator n=1 Tax=Humidisolicoccus flavus TaxID=3111414 RepID=UPI003250DE3A